MWDCSSSTKTEPYALALEAQSPTTGPWGKVPSDSPLTLTVCEIAKVSLTIVLSYPSHLLKDSPATPPFMSRITKIHLLHQIGLSASVQFSCSVVSNSLRPHGLQHARPPCPSPNLRAYSDSCPYSRWCHPTIASSVVPFSCPQSFPSPVYWLSTIISICGSPH